MLEEYLAPVLHVSASGSLIKYSVSYEYAPREHNINRHKV